MRFAGDPTRAGATVPDIPSRSSANYDFTVIELLPPRLARVLHATWPRGDAYLVGGCVRDWKLGLPVKDFDIEVHGVSFAQLAEALQDWGKVDLVGRSFGVAKLTLAPGETHDFSIPRRDSKVAPGHKGFDIDFDPSLTPRQASARRDFTINAMMVRVRDGVLLDHHGGMEDLERRLLRHTSPAFVDDPLRVLRGMQFVARFNLSTAPETLELARSMVAGFTELARERVRDEWIKWALSPHPAAGLRFLRDSGWLAHFPGIADIPGVEQDPEWHPEGDVWTHTGHCLEALVRLPEWTAADPATRLILSLAVLLHDVGKATTTHREIRDGRERILSAGHETAALAPARAFLERTGFAETVASRVLPLVAQHMAHLGEPTPRAVRRLANRLAPATIRELCTVMTADSQGRPPRPRGVPPTVAALQSAAEALAVAEAAPRPLVLGRHLQELGLAPGPIYGSLLGAAFDAQLEGAFSDLPGGLHWVRRHLAEKTDLRSL